MATGVLVGAVVAVGCGVAVGESGEQASAVAVKAVRAIRVPVRALCLGFNVLTA